MNLPRAWRVRTLITALLIATAFATFLPVGGVVLMVRVPQAERAAREVVARETKEMGARMEFILGTLESRMELLGQYLPDNASNDAISAILDRAVGDGQAIRALYFVPPGDIVAAAGLSRDLRARREDLLGSDLSAHPLIRAVRANRQTQWSDKYLSALSGDFTVGLAHPVGSDRLLLAEVPLSYLLSTLQLAAGEREASIWLVDRAGEIVADNQGGRSIGTMNLLQLPVLKAAREGREPPPTFELGMQTLVPAVTRSARLDWYFLAGAPAGLDEPRVRAAVAFVVGGFIGTMLMGMLLAPFWSGLMTRPLKRIIERAGRVAHGEAPGAWPRSRIAEFNELAADLESMATALTEREQKFQAIFNAVPVPMAVADPDQDFLVLDVNDAWCREMGRRREDVIGRSSNGMRIWAQSEDRSAALETVLRDGVVRFEAALARGDGSTVLCQNYGRLATAGTARLLIWASVDISDLRRIGDELRRLNVDLEARVDNRTQALAAANEELSATLDRLRATQSELVRAEKLAALGSLVAGIAHELNTPLGNSLLAATSLTDEVNRFTGSMGEGVRRSALERLLTGVAQAADITTRNLQRAAELVTSFKQVAVDQTSAQRRRFELSEVVEEMVVSLKPSLRRTPYRIEVDVPAKGFELDSYPGPLGQTIANLVNNAVLHGFDGRASGTIRIAGSRDNGGNVVLTVSDDGKGIPEALRGRIFDPFVTTRLGRGGSGLGLHISYNAVVNVMGGTIRVESEEGRGTTFVISLPPVAPRPDPQAAA